MGGVQRLSVGRNGDLLVETAVERPAVGRGAHGESALETAAEVRGVRHSDFVTNLFHGQKRGHEELAGRLEPQLQSVIGDG
jgi:hypothetical protein